MKQHKLSIEDHLERAYAACNIPIENVMAGIKKAIRDYLESLGFMIDLVKHPGTDREKVLVYFDLDRMLSYEQVRNGIILNQSDAIKYFYINKSQVRIDMKLVDEYGVS